jgi:hypothetical protein
VAIGVQWQAAVPYHLTQPGCACWAGQAVIASGDIPEFGIIKVTIPLGETGDPFRAEGITVQPGCTLGVAGVQGAYSHIKLLKRIYFKLLR